MQPWVEGIIQLVMDPERFFREQQEERGKLEHAILFLVLAATVLGAVRYTLIPAYPASEYWFRPVMASILIVPGMLYIVFINSLFAQAVLSYVFQDDQDAASILLSTYPRTVAVFCYAMLIPVLLLWIPPFLPWKSIALIAVALISIHTTRVAVLGLSIYHNIPALAAGLESFAELPKKDTRIVVAFIIAIALLYTVQLALIGIPETLFA